MTVATVLSVVAVAYNNIVNRWEPFQGWAYVPFNVAFVAGMIFGGSAILDLSTRDLGLDVDAAVLGLPVVIVTLIGIAMFTIAATRHRHRIVDARVADRRGWRLVYYVLVRIPVGTAVAEEILFRGVLFAAWRAAGMSTLTAAVAASVAFGLWHVSPTVTGMRMNDPAASSARVRAAVIGAVTITTIAGFGLTWLRLRTGDLLAPIVAHAGVNSVSALASAYAARRT